MSGSDWKIGRGLLGPLRPLIGEWVSRPEEQTSQMPADCQRSFRPFGKRWIQLEANWDLGARGMYGEIALFGASGPEGALGFYSFTSDGKRSEGRLADGSDIDPRAIAFEAQMPAGLARSLYWPLDNEPGFFFAVESKTKAGWNRFLLQTFRPANR